MKLGREVVKMQDWRMMDHTEVLQKKNTIGQTRGKATAFLSLFQHY